MKKILLFATLAAAGLCASANDYFDVKLEGKTLENGETVQLPFEIQEIQAGPNVIKIMEAAADFNVVSKNVNPVVSFCVLNGANNTNEEIKAAGINTQLCYNNGGVNGNEMNCLMSTDANTLYSSSWVMPGSALDKFEWQMHATNLQENSDFTLQVEFWVSDSATNNTPIADSKTTVYLHVFNKENGVNGVSAENGVARYFDLQGREVANPEAGLYVVRRGNKTTKEFIR